MAALAERKEQAEKMRSPAWTGRRPPARPASSPLSPPAMEPALGRAARAQTLGATGRMGAAASTRPVGSVGILGAWENREGKTGTQSAAQEKVRVPAHSSSRLNCLRVCCSRTQSSDTGASQCGGGGGRGAAHSLGAWPTVSRVPRLLPKGQSEPPTLCLPPAPTLRKGAKSTNKQTGSET